MVSWRAESKARAVARGKMIRWVGEGKRRYCKFQGAYSMLKVLHNSSCDWWKLQAPKANICPVNKDYD